MGIRYHDGSDALTPDFGSAINPMCGYRLNRDGLVAVLDAMDTDDVQFALGVLRLQPADVPCMVEQRIGDGECWLALDNGRVRVPIGADVPDRVYDFNMQVVADSLEVGW